MNLCHYFSSFLLGVLALASATAAVAGEVKRPNFVVMFLDDSGWGDFHPFGSPPYPTPNVERLAEQGWRYDNFYVPQAVCSASRAALLTGTFPGRNRVMGAHAPRQPALDPKFPTLAEVLRAAGYATGIFGKWHVGDVDGQRPLDRGFDEHHGIYYSNDMWRHHPTNPEFWGKYPLVYWENDQPRVPDSGPEDQDQFTTWLTEAAVDFINRHAGQPFFCYIPHPQPHVPLHVSEKFRGKSGHGLYGDVTMEIDWSLGQVMDALEENGLTENTVVVFTSDNGPWLVYGTHGGVTPFREGKHTSFEGGVRSACVIRYPASLSPGGHSTRVWSSVDVLPTFATLAGAPLPEGELDGHDIWPILSGQSDEPHPGDFIEITRGQNFEAIITYDGRWKLHLPRTYQSVDEGTLRTDGKPGKSLRREMGYALFDMVDDPNESTNVIEDHPGVAARLVEAAEKHRREWFPNQPPLALD